MINKDRVINEFLELVKIDSETGHEREIADFLTEKLKSLGLEVIEDDAGQKIGGSAGNLIAFLRSKKEGPTVLFSAHMDTVKPGKGVVPVIENDIIRSQGDTILGADDKSGIVAILEMLRVIQEEKINHVPIQVIFTIAEEGVLFGAKNLNPANIKGDFAYILDSNGSAGNIVIEGPAQNHINITVKGKKAHAGLSPEEGVSAIQVAARGLARMKLGRIDEETTANIGIIKGGIANNIIPDKVEMDGEARSLNREKLDKQTEHMVECLEKACQELGGEFTTKIELVYPEIKLNEQEQVVKIAMEAANNLGFPVTLTKTGGGSDANILNGYGIPTANLGCGMENVHTSDEFITVENLIKNPQYLVEIIKVISR
jgi:tripeptide aminopeptidase